MTRIKNNDERCGDNCKFCFRNFQNETYCKSDDCQHLGKVRFFPNGGVHDIEKASKMTMIKDDDVCVHCNYSKVIDKKQYCCDDSCVRLKSVKLTPIIDVSEDEVAQSFIEDVEKVELINHPLHYNKEGRKECWDEMIRKFGSDAVIIFDVLSAYKYNYRKGSKDGNPSEQEEAKIKNYMNHAANLIVQRDADGIDTQKLANIYRTMIEELEDDEK